MPRPRRLIGSCLLAVLLCGCSNSRAAIPSDELYRRLERAGAANFELVRSIHDRIAPSLDADLAAGRQPSIDIQTLSGGGDWGGNRTGAAA